MNSVHFKALKHFIFKSEKRFLFVAKSIVNSCGQKTHENLEPNLKQKGQHINPLIFKKKALTLFALFHWQLKKDNNENICS